MNIYEIDLEVIDSVPSLDKTNDSQFDYPRLNLLLGGNVSETHNSQSHITVRFDLEFLML